MELNKKRNIERKGEDIVSKEIELITKLIEKNWLNKEKLYNKYFEFVTYFNIIESPKVSIIVIAWRLHHDTLKNFQILQQQRDQNFELIFVNNGAKHDEFDSLIPYIDTYIKLNENTGAYLARNV